VGAWGARAFENDDAMDWVYVLEEAQDTTLVAEALEKVAESVDDYLEAPECNEALAAAEVIAASSAAQPRAFQQVIRSAF
jgi:hypothetical protein